MSRPFALGGVIASVILVAIGIGSLVIGLSGRSEVRNDIKNEQIVGTPDMTPTLIAKAVDEAGLKNISIPDCSVAGKPVDSGARATCFAKYMRIHALEATGGRVYAEMGQYLTADGKETSDKAAAAIDPKTKQPVANGARNVWVTATALTTALNTSFFAEQVALFSIVIGIALLLVGVGFLVLTASLLRSGPVRAGAAKATPVVATA